MPWIVQYVVFSINRYLIRQDGKTSYERVFNNAHSLILAHVQAQPPSQKLHLRAQPHEKHYSLWLGKRVTTGMNTAAHEGQILKTRTVTRLIKEQHFNSVEFSKIILPPHECESDYIKSLKKIAFHFRNCSGHSSCNKSQRCRTEVSSPWVRGSRSLLSTQAHHSRLHQPSEQINKHHHCQRHQHRSQHLNQQPFLIPQDFKCLQDFIHCVFIMLSNQGQFSLSSKPSTQISNQLRSEEESQRSQNQENQHSVSRDSSSPSGHPGNHLLLTQDQINANHQEAQSEEELLSRSHSSGMVSGRSSALFSRSEELKQVGPPGHDAYDPVPLSHLNQEERRSITE